MKFKQFVLSLLILSFSIWAVYMIYPSYSEYKETKDQLHQVEQKLLLQGKDNESLKEKNYKLKTDARSIERVAREKFGWSKPDEKIYDFSR